MTWVEELAPRHEGTASRVALTFFVAAAVVTCLEPVTGPAWVKGTAYGLPPILVLIAAAVVWAPLPWPRYTCTGLALGGLLTTLFLDVLTRDAGYSGQTVFLYPVLYAASQMRRVAAWLLAGAAVMADVALVTAFVPVPHPWADAGFFTVTTVTVTALLVQAGDRQERLVSRLLQQAAVDHLTGLVNRRHLDEVMESTLVTPGAGTALILVDLDHFKSINDQHGHPAGDSVLRAVADVIAGQCRKGDVAARIGGDELALLLPDCPLDVATRRAEEIVLAVRDTTLDLPDGQRITFSVSVGQAHAPANDGSTLEQLYTAADHALYLAKRRGRDQAATASVMAATPSDRP